MSQISILKYILKCPGIFTTAAQRENAKQVLSKKLKRRDKKLLKKNQLNIFEK